MSDEWEQQDRAPRVRKVALPLAFVLVGLMAGLLTAPRTSTPPFSVTAQERDDGVPEAAPAAALTEPGGRWKGIDGGPLSARDQAVVAWGGDRVIVWSGKALTSPTPLRDGATYDPATDTWSPMPRAPIRGRIGAATAWTGSELVIWGGAAGGQALADGAAYDPRAQRWRRLPPAPLSARRDATAVAVPGAVVIWGGRKVAVGPHHAGGAIYQPAKDRWRTMPAGPFARRSDATVSAAAAGSSVLLWSASPGSSRLAAFDPGTRRWRNVTTPRLQSSAPPVLLGMEGSVLAWGAWSMGDQGPLAMSFTTQPDWWSTVARPPFAPERGRSLHGANGIAASWSPMGGGVFFDALANTWTPIATAPAPTGLGLPAQVWAGDRLLVWHGLSEPDGKGRALIWEPPNPWQRVEGSPVPIGEHTAGLWSGWLRDQQQVLVWGGQSVGRPNTGAALDPELKLWETVPAGPLAIRTDAALVWADTEMVLLGGRDAKGTARRDIAAYAPASRSWRSLPPAPVPVEEGAAAWSGTRLFAAGVRDGDVVVASAAPRGQRWRRVPDPPLRSVEKVQVVWTGLELWVVDTGADRITGAAWEPARREWRILPVLPGVTPPAKVVWGSRRMYVMDSRGETSSLGLSIDSWRLHPSSRLRGDSAAIEWTGRRLVAYLPDARRMRFLDPRAGAWANGTPPPFERSSSAELVWTGRQLFAFGAGGVAELGGEP